MSSVDGGPDVPLGPTHGEDTPRGAPTMTTIDKQAEAGGGEKGHRPIDDESEQDEEEEDDGEIDFAQFLRNESAEEPERHQRSHLSSEDMIIQQESMASYMNRKTAMLMLYFPLA